MPIYEYQCGSCHYRFEVKQGFHDAPLTTCSRCGGVVAKMISAPAIMFKGEGWYVTDYSDKLKPPTESGTAEKPAEGPKEQKEKKDGAATPAAAGASSASSSSGGASSPSTSSPPSGSSGSSRTGSGGSSGTSA